MELSSFVFQFLKIILVLTYGILHDLIPAQISIESLTIEHTKAINTTSQIKPPLLCRVVEISWIGLILDVLGVRAIRIENTRKLNR